MTSSKIATYPDVFSAFAKGVNDGVAEAASAEDALAALRLLQVLAEQGGEMPFSQFAKKIPGDSVATLDLTLKLMQQGWVEFVGNVSETSDVRLTETGKAMIAVIERSVAAA